MSRSWDASALREGAHALDCLHGPKPTGCKGNPPQLLNKLVYTLELARSPLCGLPSAWAVALDRRHAQGDSSAEDVWWYALQEYTTTGAITPLRTSQLLDAVHELHRQVGDFERPIVHACYALHRTAECRHESLTWHAELPARSVAFDYHGPRDIQTISGELACAIEPLGFTWTLDYTRQTIGSADDWPSDTALWDSLLSNVRPNAGKTAFIDYASLERGLFGKAYAAGKPQAVADARERFASAQPSAEPEGPTARVSLATLLSLRAP